MDEKKVIRKAANNLRRKLERGPKFEIVEFMNVVEQDFERDNPKILFDVSLRNWLHERYFSVTVYPNSYRIKEL